MDRREFIGRAVFYAVVPAVFGAVASHRLRPRQGGSAAIRAAVGGIRALRTASIGVRSLQEWAALGAEDAS